MRIPRKYRGFTNGAAAPRRSSEPCSCSTVVPAVTWAAIALPLLEPRRLEARQPTGPCRTLGERSCRPDGLHLDAVPSRLCRWRPRNTLARATGQPRQSCPTTLHVLVLAALES